MPRKATIYALYREIGRAIRKLRMKRNPCMSQQSLAEEVRISRASVTNIERGHHRIQLHVLYEIAAVLEVEPHDLLPHQDRSQTERHLPADVTKELNPKERVAVGRLLRNRNEGDADEKP